MATTSEMPDRTMFRTAVRQQLDIHPALRGAMTKLYGYRGDEDGVAHGATEAPEEHISWSPSTGRQIPWK